MIEILYCLVKESLALSDCASDHVLQLMGFPPCLENDRVIIFILSLEELVATLSE